MTSPANAPFHLVHEPAAPPGEKVPASVSDIPNIGLFPATFGVDHCECVVPTQCGAGCEYRVADHLPTSTGLPVTLNSFDER